MSEMLKNPFVNQHKYPYNDELYDFVLNKNLRTHFENVYVFCKLNDSINYQKILECNIKIEDFKKDY